MKLRKFELKIMEITVDHYGEPIIGPRPAPFDYRKATIDILRSAGPGGADPDSIARAVYLCGKIREAFEHNTGHVLLQPDDYNYLRDRVVAFRQWSAMADVIHEYITYVKELKEEEFELKRAAAA